MGNATACLHDAWSLFNNVAGLAGLKEPTVAATYDVLPSIPAFAKTALAISAPGKLALGFGAFRFGDASYNENLVVVGAGTQWNHTSIGMKMSYVRYAADGLGNTSIVSFGLGSITRFTPWMAVGMHLTNLNQAWLSKSSGDRVPAILTAGFLFNMTNHAIVSVEVEQRINEKPTGRVGGEFEIHKKFLIRSGFTVKPFAGTAGVGFRLMMFKADYSMHYAVVMGIRHQASVVFTVSHKNKPR